MKKIVIDAREWPTSTGRYVRELVEQLQEVDTDLSHRYYILMKPKDLDSWEPKSKRFTKVASRYKEFTFAEQIGLFWQLLVIQPDLVHFAMVQQPILYFGKVVTTMHDLTTLRFNNPSKNPLVFWFKQRVYVWVNFIAAHKSKAVIVPTEFVKDDVARNMRTNSRKITVIYESGDTYPMKPEAVAELEDKQFIMYIGRPSPHKNLSRLIEAYGTLKQSMPELHLALVGKRDALYKRHEQEVERLGIPDVHFTGFLSDARVRWLYEHAAVYVFPSLSEGFGLPGLEAMANGAPVASSNATCLPEVYGDAALYFDPRNVDDMAGTIKRILTDEKLRARLISAGRKQVAKYSWRRMAEQTLEVYKRVLGER
ncbi:MAG TPA: glycosyltransferase family 1 protein [Verrucomicrobiae bacterium]|nr:glycosyltransferase family 1 protein [Verrucomicrobiae bacterium]